MSYTVEHISLSSLQSDLENPRHKPAKGQAEVIAWMLSEHGEEILNLAEDIAARGLNPIEIPLVMRDPANGKRYTVLEGNRRIVALKLLAQPSLADDHKWERRFSELARKAKGRVPVSLDVVVAKDRESADWMVERRHSGQDQGRGLIPWNAIQKARAEQLRSGKAARYQSALELIDFAIERSLLGDGTEGRLVSSNFPVTTLDRMLGDTDVRRMLGISRGPTGWQFDIDPQESLKGLTRVLTDLAGNMSVSTVKNKDLRQAYLSKFGDETPDLSKALPKPVPLTGAQVTVSVPASARSKRVLPKTTARKRLIERGFQVKDKTVRPVLTELQALSLDEFPIAIGCMTRVFIEQSSDYYVAGYGLKVNAKGRQPTLREKVHSVAEKLKVDGKISPDQAKAIIRADVEYFHRVVHSANHATLKSELIAIWDKTFEAYVRGIWDSF